VTEEAASGGGGARRPAGEWLLAVARRAIEDRLRGAEAVASSAAEDAERRGVFVTLRRRDDGTLRGCVGFVDPRYALEEAVARAASAAAADDLRFDPVTAAELPTLRIDISVLGPVRRVEPEQVEIGVHGVVVRCGGSSGLLLPQVAVEHGWDRETLLDKTCWKAGLPAGAWRRADAEVLVFTTRVICEED
jgi:AmmeMemoRadiSam system protein A